MKILHLLSGGGIGGIEMLCRDIADKGEEQNEFCFLFAGGEIAEEIIEKGIPVYSFYKNKLYARMVKLVQLVKKERYDVIIVHHEGIGIYAFYLGLLFFFRKVKFIKYLHCSFEEKYFFQGNRAKDVLNYHILKKTLVRSDCMVAVSNFVKQSYCEEFGINKDRVKVIYNGIDVLQNVNGLCRKQSERDVTKLLYVGRLIETKGVHILLDAVKKLIDRKENVELDILGDGPMRMDYEQIAEKLGIRNKVHFRGYVLDKQKFYENADIFVCPSICQEAFGISIIEALAQGLICVASNVGGIPEIIDDGKDGFLVQSGNGSELAETLLKAKKCVKSPMHEEMQNKAIQKSQEFKVSQTINGLQKLCRELAGG